MDFTSQPQQGRRNYYTWITTLEGPAANYQKNLIEPELGTANTYLHTQHAEWEKISL